MSGQKKLTDICSTSPWSFTPVVTWSRAPVISIPGVTGTLGQKISWEGWALWDPVWCMESSLQGCAPKSMLLHLQLVRLGFDNVHWEPSMEISWPKGIPLLILLTKSFLDKRVSSLPTRHTLTKGSWHIPLTKRNLRAGTPLAKGPLGKRILGWQKGFGQQKALARGLPWHKACRKLPL